MSDNATAERPVKKKKDTVNVLVIELTGQQDSGFILTGLDNNMTDDDVLDLPSRISAPNGRAILNRSKMLVNEKDAKTGKMMQKLKRIRYIKGCELILEDEQKAAGYEPHPTEDIIWVKNGTKHVAEAGNEIGLYRYLKACEYNESNPDRPENAQTIFREISTNVTVANIEKELDMRRKATDYVYSLKTTDKKGETEYNEDAISYLVSLFKLPPSDEDSLAEDWVTLHEYADSNPETFMNVIANEKSIYVEEVNRALSYGVIQLDDTQAIFADTKKKIMDFPDGISILQQEERLVDFFVNPSNLMAYKTMRAAMQLKERAVVAPK